MPTVHQPTTPKPAPARPTRIQRQYITLKIHHSHRDTSSPTARARQFHMARTEPYTTQTPPTPHFPAHGNRGSNRLSPLNMAAGKSTRDRTPLQLLAAAPPDPHRPSRPNWPLERAPPLQTGTHAPSRHNPTPDKKKFRVQRMKASEGKEYPALLTSSLQTAECSPPTLPTNDGSAEHGESSSKV